MCNGPNITGKDKANCLIELQRILAENRRQTRSIEFQVNISLWTLIAASVWFLHGKIKLSEDGMWWFVGIAAATYLAHLCLWMWPIQESEDKDALRLNKWTRLVEQECRVSVTEELKQVSATKWVFFETSLTALLLVIAGLVLWK